MHYIGTCNNLRSADTVHIDADLATMITVGHLLCSESLEAVSTEPVSTGALERSSEQVVVTVHALQFCHSDVK